MDGNQVIPTRCLVHVGRGGRSEAENDTPVAQANAHKLWAAFGSRHVCLLATAGDDSMSDLPCERGRLAPSRSIHEGSRSNATLKVMKLRVRFSVLQIRAVRGDVALNAVVAQIDCRCRWYHWQLLAHVCRRPGHGSARPPGLGVAASSGQLENSRNNLKSTATERHATSLTYHN